MPLSRRALATAALFAFSLPSLADEGSFAHVSLREIRNNPNGFKNTRVTFKCRLNKTEDLYAPVHTAFTAEQHAQVSGWGAEAKVFISKERQDVFTNLFIRRDKEWLADFLGTPRYSWLMVWGEVKSVFAGQPWIEIYDYEVMSDKHFTDATLGAAIRAYEAYDKNDMESVLAELSRVSDYALPQTDRYHVVKMKAQAAWSVGRDADAKRSAERGLKVRPADPELRAIAEGVAPRSLTGGGETPPPGAKEGEEGAAPKKVEEPKKVEPKEPGEDEGEEGGMVEELRERVARLEKENGKLRGELDAAREDMAAGREMPRRVAEGR
ncbi:MAG: hypothetical protein FD180_2803 [Planctomycetota bacterium]|nr:MAG: hypothetical protein FD180_2803 [Planctomycetota bacterium]